MENIGVFKARQINERETVFLAPEGTKGYWRRDVSKDGQTITYRRVA